MKLMEIMDDPKYPEDPDDFTDAHIAEIAERMHAAFPEETAEEHERALRHARYLL